MPKVSIIVAVYNVERYLKQCLDSLVNQTLQDIEIVCVNDGSTDNSLEILQEYASKDNRLKIINQENQGPGIARNNAIENTTGEYLMIIDPDDWLEHNACELAYNQISKNQNDMVFFGFQRYYEETNETKIDTNKLKPFYDVIENPHINLANLQNNYLKTAFTTTQIYLREFIIANNIKYSETYLAEDLVFLIKAIINAKTVSILNQPIYSYRIRKTSLSSSLEKHWQELITNRELALEIIQQSENEMDYICPYLIYFTNSSYYWLNIIYINNPKLEKFYYEKIRDLFLKIHKKYSETPIYTLLPTKKFEGICNNNFEEYKLKTILKRIFEIKNIGEYKVINVLGIKTKIKRGIKKQ